MAPQAIELDAKAVYEAPVLGYEIVVTGPDDDGTGSVRHLRLIQPWMKSEETGTTIQVDIFEEYSPFDAVLVTGTTTAAYVPSFQDALADFATRWDISSQLHHRLQTSPPIDALSVSGGGIEALVWPDGMTIGAQEPLATMLRLLIADFSEEARRACEYADLQAAVDALPPDVKSQYVPDASKFCAQAAHEHSEKVQCELKKKRRPFRIMD
jgi:hypothetical protein